MVDFLNIFPSPMFWLEQLSKVTEACLNFWWTSKNHHNHTAFYFHLDFFIGGEGGPSAKKRAQVKKHEGIKVGPLRMLLVLGDGFGRFGPA